MTFLSSSIVVVVVFLLSMKKVYIRSFERKMTVKELLNVVKFLIQTIWYIYKYICIYNCIKKYDLLCVEFTKKTNSFSLFPPPLKLTHIEGGECTYKMNRDEQGGREEVKNWKC